MFTKKYIQLITVLFFSLACIKEEKKNYPVDRHKYNKEKWIVPENASQQLMLIDEMIINFQQLNTVKFENKKAYELMGQRIREKTEEILSTNSFSEDQGETELETHLRALRSHAARLEHCQTEDGQSIFMDIYSTYLKIDSSFAFYHFY